MKISQCNETPKNKKANRVELMELMGLSLHASISTINILMILPSISLISLLITTRPFEYVMVMVMSGVR